MSTTRTTAHRAEALPGPFTGPRRLRDGHARRRLVQDADDAVRVFDADPELLTGVDPTSAEVLRRRATVRRKWLEPGGWNAPADAAAHEGWFGLLVLDGLLVRTLHVAGRDCPELVGAGDLLRPWDDDAAGSVPTAVTWTVLEPTTLAVLDARFAAGVCRFPSVPSVLLQRTVKRSRALAFHLALAHVRHADTRLRMLLWHLADRWGRVTPEGVYVPLALKQETIAQLACMRRPTASSALQRLVRSGELERLPDATWILKGDGPTAA